MLTVALSACAARGKPPKDASFLVSEVSVTAVPRADKNSAAPLDDATIKAVGASVLEEAYRSSRKGPPKLLEIRIVTFNVASQRDAFVGGRDNYVDAEVVVRDLATTAAEGQYATQAQTGSRRCCGAGAPIQPSEAALATARRLGKVAWEAAYTAERKPLTVE